AARDAGATRRCRLRNQPGAARHDADTILPGRAAEARSASMRGELDRLRLAVDEATTALIAAECDLDAARTIEHEASAVRVGAEGVRNAAVARLNEARTALDRRLG